MAGTPSRSQRPPYEQSVHVPLQPEKTVTSDLPHQPAVFGAHGHFLECLSVQEQACSGVYRQFPRYRFRATISVWVKHHRQIPPRGTNVEDGVRRADAACCGVAAAPDVQKSHRSEVGNIYEPPSKYK